MSNLIGIPTCSWGEVLLRVHPKAKSLGLKTWVYLSKDLCKYAPPQKQWEHWQKLPSAYFPGALELSNGFPTSGNQLFNKNGHISVTASSFVACRLPPLLHPSSQLCCSLENQQPNDSGSNEKQQPGSCWWWQTGVELPESSSSGNSDSVTYKAPHNVTCKSPVKLQSPCWSLFDLSPDSLCADHTILC